MAKLSRNTCHDAAGHFSSPETQVLFYPLGIRPSPSWRGVAELSRSRGDVEAAGRRSPHDRSPGRIQYVKLNKDIGQHRGAGSALAASL